MSTAEGAVCRPNISPTGRRRRQRVGVAAAVLAVVALVIVVVLGLAWYWRALAVAVPSLIAASGWLQAHRNTCVARAAEGTFENDDATTVKMADDDVAASRKV